MADETEDPISILALSWAAGIGLGMPLITIYGPYVAAAASMMPAVNYIAKIIDDYETRKFAERQAAHERWAARVQAEEAQKAAEPTKSKGE